MSRRRLTYLIGVHRAELVVAGGAVAAQWHASSPNVYAPADVEGDALTPRVQEWLRRYVGDAQQWADDARRDQSVPTAHVRVALLDSDGTAAWRPVAWWTLPGVGDLAIERHDTNAPAWRLASAAPRIDVLTRTLDALHTAHQRRPTCAPAA